MFVADLHIHSKFSRATSRDLDPEHLVQWAARKGIQVVGSGDCVHPGWLMDLKDRLIPDGDGLYRLRPELEAAVLSEVPVMSAGAATHPRFLLTTEISTIYKKDDKTRKVHHLVLLPDFAAADRFAAKLAAIGNISSDGRPILGLDSRDLLEIVLGVGAGSFLIPAHIWTPWFSALGAKSGFDSISACYGDLAEHIFAVETGLSSDPAMNWRVSALDRYRLVSNSDAHSPSKLGREATVFACEPGFAAIRRALETGEGYGGTIEFFPEEGKYHFDGHRACGVRLTPAEAISAGGICPVCGKPLTMGVAHRVEELADRREGAEPGREGAGPVTPPPTAGSVASYVPLPEMLGEIFGTGAASKRVAAAYERALSALGPELTILSEVPREDLVRFDPLLAESVMRLRAGKVRAEAGYDGEYGAVRLFAPGEIDTLTQGNLLFDAPLAVRRPKAKPSRRKAVPAVAAAPATHMRVPETERKDPCGGILSGLDADQAAAAAASDAALLVLAGPGAGKTRMLTHRIAHLVTETGVAPERCLAVTFTRRATEELSARLALLPGGAQCVVHSFHSLGLAILRAESAAAGLAADFRIADTAERQGLLASALEISRTRAGKLLQDVSRLKRLGRTGEDGGDGEVAAAQAALARLGREGGWIDFDDLVIEAARLLEAHPEIAVCWHYAHVAADEFQDIDVWQYRLLKQVSAEGTLCVIGDPDQAIYGFRGADADCFGRFRSDFPGCRVLRLNRNYRSCGCIVTASAALMGRMPEGIQRTKGPAVELHVAADPRGEADFVAARIGETMGGNDMLSAGAAPATGREAGPLSFADFAVLYRTDAQAAPLREAFDAAGIPYKKSTPARIGAHAGVAALLAALPAGLFDAPPEAALDAAVESARQAGGDPAELAEARIWLNRLAGTAASVAELREKAALAVESDFFDPRADRVSLLTMHAAKGLEFQVVFVVGAEEGVAPFRLPDEDAGTEKPEERRLFYVAMTRARDRLILSRASRRFWRGQSCTLPPSSFLGALGPLVRSAAPRRRTPQQYRLF